MCKFCAFLDNALDHPQVLVSTEGSWHQFLPMPRDNYIHSLYETEYYLFFKISNRENIVELQKGR